MARYRPFDKEMRRLEATELHDSQQNVARLEVRESISATKEPARRQCRLPTSPHMRAEPFAPAPNAQNPSSPRCFCAAPRCARDVIPSRIALLVSEVSGQWPWLENDA